MGDGTTGAGPGAGGGADDRVNDALAGLVAAELDRPAPPQAVALARAIAAERGGCVAAVLLYGSCRRAGDASGLLDFYVLHDGARAFHGRALPALLESVLPPTVLLRVAADGTRAKVAVMSRRRFLRRLRPGGWDTTIWARFCQPSTLIYARDPAARAWAHRAVARAAATGALWAARLGPEAAAPGEYWRGLFARTYGAELRAERAGRSALLHAASAAWFDAVLAPALAQAGARPVVLSDGRLRPGVPGPGRWGASWAARRVAGKALNLARLVKAAFTFEGGADYLAWKISRHGGVNLEPTPWQRRHPVLAAPAVLWRLWRRGAVR